MMARTGNGDYAYDSTGSALLEFFSKAGSQLKGKQNFYGEEASAISLFRPAWTTNSYKAMQLAMWVRDCRGGAGNRSGFRDINKWIAEKDSKWIEANMHFIPELGRWDDLLALVDTPCEDSALKFWVRAIQDGNGLAAKWAPRASKTNVKRKELFNKLRKTASMSPKDFRKLLSGNTEVVESAMCQDSFYEIDYNKVPSVAMARYNSAFKKHDTARFDSWKNALETGVDEEGKKVKVNASVLFPHDCIRTLHSEDAKVANAQFDALPNYMEGTNERIMAITDFSYSMSVKVSGSVSAMDVSMALGLYCSDRLGEDNPFYRKFIPFSDTSKLVTWKDKTFNEAARGLNDGFCGSTNIGAALEQILEAAQMFGATNEQIPSTLLIVSDMQFNQGCSDNETSVEIGLKRWEEAGYTRPKVVYWNTAGCDGAPTTMGHKDVALISGFSPSILTAVLGGEDFSPMAILDKAIEKYEVVDPTK